MPGGTTTPVGNKEKEDSCRLKTGMENGFCPGNSAESGGCGDGGKSSSEKEADGKKAVDFCTSRRKDSGRRAARSDYFSRGVSESTGAS